MKALISNAQPQYRFPGEGSRVDSRCDSALVEMASRAVLPVLAVVLAAVRADASQCPSVLLDVLMCNASDTATSLTSSWVRPSHESLGVVSCAVAASRL
jgi:hypothetical protein